MERNKKIPLLLILLQVCIVKCEECPSHLDERLPCYNDFDKTITCDWKSASDRTDTLCVLHAKEVPDEDSEMSDFYSASCDLQPVDIPRSALMRCVLIFKDHHTFHETDTLSINVSCGPEKPIVTISYKPFCHVKVNPRKPVVNETTIFWSMDYNNFDSWSYELQWKLLAEPWSKAAKLKQEHIRSFMPNILKEELDAESFIRGENYQARVRVTVRGYYRGPWSEWSPSVSWESTVGREKQPSDVDVNIWQMIVAGAAIAVLLLVIAFLRWHKNTWVYIVKRVRGPPLPNPATSFLQDLTLQNWIHPYFTSDSFHYFLKPVEIVSVEITSTINTISPRKPETVVTKDRSTFESTGSSFSNPSYSELCASPPPIFPLSLGNLEACASDSPYGPVGSGEAAQQCAKVTEDKMDILKLLSKQNCSGESVVEVVSDYEKTEKLQMDRLRLQSLDSGVGSGEEVSQESMEADSITGHDEDGQEGREKDGGSGITFDFQKLLRSGSAVFGKGSIQVCSDHEAAETVCGSSPGLPSLDYNLSRNAKEQEEKSSESASLLFPPCSILPQPPLAFIFSSSSALCPLLTSAGGSVEPSGDGYKPLRQEQS